MYTKMETLTQVLEEMKKELDRMPIDAISKDIIIIFGRMAYHVGRSEGLMEMYESAVKAIAGPEPVPTPQPEEPTPDNPAPEPQGEKVICTDCGTEQDSHQKEYDLDCKCGGSFVKVL